MEEREFNLQADVSFFLCVSLVKLKKGGLNLYFFIPIIDTVEEVMGK